MLEDLNLDKIQDEYARECIKKLLNIIENLQTEIRELRAENQRLRDENNRLKGEQGKPDIKRNVSKKNVKDISSEKERRERKDWQKGSKRDKLIISREEIVYVDKNKLPLDAEFKGYEDVIVQDIKIESDNIKFRKEKYYSRKEKKTYTAELPKGYDGEFGPGIKSLIISLHYESKMTEPKILEHLNGREIHISEGEISNILIKEKEEFHKEKEEIYKSGIESSNYQNIDDTKIREDGKTRHCHIVCNEYYSGYFTTDKKDRLSVIEVLMNLRELKYVINEETIKYLETFKLPVHVLEGVKRLPVNKDIEEKKFINFIKSNFPTLGKQHMSRLIESAAIAYYHSQLGFPIVELIVCDDAPQFKLITEELALCWVHEGRHYKKLEPVVKYNCEILEKFLGKFWEFYKKLLKYKIEPTEEKSMLLSKEFDEIFSQVTGYSALDERIKLTREKKENLLMVLKHPEIPLHNNAAEISARNIARRRDVSFGTRTPEGTRAHDTFLTIYATAKKLGISFYRYIYDRISKKFEIPSLAELIKQKAKLLPVGVIGGEH